MSIHSLFLGANVVCTDPTNLTYLCNPVHANNIPEFLGYILVAIGVIIGLVTVGMVAYSGFQMIVAQGNEEDISQAKSNLQWSVSGLIIIMLAFAIVSALGKFLQVRDVNPTPGPVVSPIASSDIFTLANTIFTGFLTVIGIVAIFFIVVNGFRYVTARGDEEVVSKARNGLQWSVIGLIVAALAYVIVTAVSRFITP